MSHASTEKASRIPAFATRQEEAEFWDTHDLTDYWDEFEPVEFKIEGPFSEAVTLHIDLETRDEAKAIAAEQGVPWNGLLYLWIVERRDADRQRRAGSGDPTAPNGPGGAEVASEFGERVLAPGAAT